MTQVPSAGQWLGTISRPTTGYCVVNIDADRPLQGVVQVDDAIQPFSAQLALAFTDRALTGSLSHFSAQSQSTAGASPPVQLPNSGVVSGTIEGQIFTATWHTDVGTLGTVSLQRREPSPPRNADQVLSWAAFREWAFDEAKQHPTLIFRGHSSASETLVTSFHRTGRRNLIRYDNEDVPRLRRAVEPVLGKSYDTRDPFDYGALLNLGQHHGFPTPLLDWTESPFVAAYFSFSRLAKRLKEDAANANVRIFIFETEAWPYGTVQTIAEIRPTFARLHLGARDNPRVVPQQSVHMFSNLVDIETFIEDVEKQAGRRFLRRIDVAATERAVAMRDLDVMGVTAAALFPGVEGACRALAEKWF